MTDSLNQSDSSASGKRRRSSKSLLGGLIAVVRKFRLGRFGRRALMAVVLAATVALVAATLLPLGQYWDQGMSIQQAKQELADLEERRSDLEYRLERAGDTKVIEREARKQMSLVRPGDELFRVVVPSDVIDLPKAWYLPGVEYLVTGQSD